MAEAPLLSYQPDLDTTKPGVITDGDHFVPTLRGLAGAPTAVDTPLATLAATCIGAASLTKLDETVRTFAGTATKLYEAGATTWSDVSAGAGSYTSVTNRWRFTQFGNVSIAASKQNTLQASSSGAFAAIGTAPMADIVETVGQFVLAFNINDGTDKPHGWACSAYGDHTSWTPSTSTQANSGTLTSIPGAITAGRRYGTQVFVGKRKGCYVGSYVGNPFVWQFDEIPADSGPISQEACINIGTPEQPKIIYVAPDNIYVYEGARPVPIGIGLIGAFLGRLNTEQLGKTILLADRRNEFVRLLYCAGSSTTINAGLAYNYRTGAWTIDNKAVEFAFNYIGGSLNYDDLGTYYSTYNDFPAKSYDEAFISGQGAGLPAIFSSSHKLQTVNGACADSFIVTGDYGSDERYSLVRRLKPAWLRTPTTGALTMYKKASFGDAVSAGIQADMSSSRFDVLQSSRWHRAKIEMSGDWEANRFAFDAVEQGLE